MAAKSKYFAVAGKLCVACGSCLKVCPQEAIQIRQGVRAMVDAAACRGCGKCVAECPADVILLQERGEGCEAAKKVV